MNFKQINEKYTYGYIYGEEKVKVQKTSMILMCLMGGINLWTIIKILINGGSIKDAMIFAIAYIVFFFLVCIFSIEYFSVYVIEEYGVKLDCKLPFIKKKFSWEEIKLLKESTLLVHVWNRWKYRKAEFFILSIDPNYNNHIYDEKDQAIQNNRKRRVICIPKNEETIRCLKYYEPRMINCAKEVTL